MIAAQRIQHISSGGLALLVHGLLLLGLMVGVSWNIPPHLPIEADLWTELPAPALSVPPPEYPAQPEVLPEAAPTPEPMQPNQAQIALEKAENTRLEAQRRQEEQQAALQQKIEKKLAAEKLIETLRRTEQERLDKERLDKERLEKEKNAQARRLIEQELAREMREELEAESSQLNVMQSLAKASGQSRSVREFQERIRTKIKDALVLPQNLKEDTEVIFQVGLLPNGEVVRVSLIRTSGQPLYDGAVERAIFKASPLPLPKDRETAAQFREGLTLKFRPSDGTSNNHNSR